MLADTDSLPAAALDIGLAWRADVGRDASARAARLNERYRHHAAIDVLRYALHDPDLGNVALVSSFGAESAVLLHLLSRASPGTPVLFIDTRLLFAETLAYQAQLAATLRLTNIRMVRADPVSVAQADPDGHLHARAPDACCHLRKTAPLQSALEGFDGWITGRKRFQSTTRSTLDFFEVEETGRLRVNPLAHWTPHDVQTYMAENALPPHPLVAKGYPSIGCAPCTSAVKPGEDSRAGRWRGTEKTECGIHFIGGQMVRSAAAKTVNP